MILIAIEIEEAAIVYGDSKLAILMRTTIPLTTPGFLVTAMFLCLFSVILTLQPRVTLHVTFGIFSTTRETQSRLISSASLLSKIPMILIFALLQHNVVRGFSAGAIK